DKTGVYYVGTQDALNGHRLCEAAPGSVAVNGLTSGNDAPLPNIGPVGNESFHPNELGYQLLENAILTKTHNLTASMPQPDLSVKLPSEQDLPILDAPHTGRPIKTTEYDPDITENVLFKNSPNDVNINGVNHVLAPNTVVNAELHSSPTNLGS